MVIGDRSLFAVEFELDENPDGYLLDGYFQYWIGGKARSSDYKKMLYLLDVAVQLQKMISVNRDDVLFFDMEKQKLFKILCGTIIRGDYYYINKYEKEALESQWWGRFSIDLLNVESPSICYLIAKEKQLRLLVGTYDINVGVEEYFFSADYFYNILKETCDQIFSWSEQEKEKEKN